MQISSLPEGFQFQFIPELNGSGYVFRLVEGSRRCYLADDLTSWLSSDIDECLDLLRYQDLAKTPLRDIGLPILQRLKYQELQSTHRLKELDEQDIWVVRLLGFRLDRPQIG